MAFKCVGIEKQRPYNSISLATFLFDFSGVHLVLPLDAIYVTSHFSPPVTRNDNYNIILFKSNKIGGMHTDTLTATGK